MSAIRTLQDLEAWKAAKELAKMIYIVSSTGPISQDFGYRDQIRRAAVSTMSNVAEVLLSMSDDTIGLVCGWQRSIYKR